MLACMATPWGLHACGGVRVICVICAGLRKRLDALAASHGKPLSVSGTAATTKRVGLSNLLTNPEVKAVARREGAGRAGASARSRQGACGVVGCRLPLPKRAFLRAPRHGLALRCRAVRCPCVHACMQSLAEFNAVGGSGVGASGAAGGQFRVCITRDQVGSLGIRSVHASP